MLSLAGVPKLVAVFADFDCQKLLTETLSVLVPSTFILLVVLVVLIKSPLFIVVPPAMLEYKVVEVVLGIQYSSSWFTYTVNSTDAVCKVGV